MGFSSGGGVYCSTKPLKGVAYFHLRYAFLVYPLEGVILRLYEFCCVTKPPESVGCFILFTLYLPV